MEDVTFSSHVPGEEPNGVTTLLRDPEGNERSGDINLTLVDPNFIPQYGLNMVAGRNFREGQGDLTSALIVNEACVKAYGFNRPEDILGQDFQQWGGDGKVIGVVSDFNYLSLHQDVGLLSLKVWPDQFQKITVSLGNTDLAETLTQLEASWQSLYPNVPFNYYFLDDNFNQQYAADEKFMAIVNLFTAIAVAIGLLGLVSFTSFWCDRRRRELSIRKVLGAHPRDLIWKLYRQFVMPVLVGFIASAPLALYFGNIWIGQFAYQNELTVFMVVIPLLFILGLATLVIGVQTARVVSVNPVVYLKEE